MTIGLLLLSGVQVLNFILLMFTGWHWLFTLLTVGVLVMAYLIIQFFRIPKRTCVFTKKSTSIDVLLNGEIL